MTTAKTARSTARQAVAVLNRIHETDPTVMPALIDARVPCNKKLAKDPTVQVGRRGVKCGYTVGLLGVLNGLFGVGHCGYGFIQAVYDDEGELVRFELGD